MADLISRRVIALKLCTWRTMQRKKNNRRVRAVDIACSQLIPPGCYRHAQCSHHIFRLALRLSPFLKSGSDQQREHTARRHRIVASFGAVSKFAACFGHSQLLLCGHLPVQLKPAKQCHPKRKETPEGGFRSNLTQSCSIRTSPNWASTFPSSTSWTSSPPRHGRWRWFHSPWLR